MYWIVKKFVEGKRDLVILLGFKFKVLLLFYGFFCNSIFRFISIVVFVDDRRDVSFVNNYIFMGFKDFFNFEVL